MGFMKRLADKKILIIGEGRHGKDSVAEILRDRFGLTFQSSSQACSDIFIFDTLKHIYGYKNSTECYDDRHNHRATWYNLIRQYNRTDETRLAREILKTSQVYVGMRSVIELEACIEQNIFDHIVWVDASKRLPPEGSESNTITVDYADDIILNNHDLAVLHNNTCSWIIHVLAP